MTDHRGRLRVTPTRIMVLAAIVGLCVHASAAGEAPEGPPDASGAAASLWEFVQECFRAVFAPVNRALAAIPMSTARWVALAYIAAGALWTFLLPRRYIYEGAPSLSRWRDLRLWAVVFLIPFALIYLLW